VEVTFIHGVHSVTTTNESIRSDASALDWHAEDEVSVESVVFAIGRKHAVASLNTNVFGEEVFTEEATTECSVTAVWDECTTEHTKGESRSEALASSRSRWWHHRGLWVFGGDRTGDGCGGQNRCH
jgi:hypothetical protein